MTTRTHAPHAHAPHASRSTTLSAYVESISDLGRITADEEISLAKAWREHGCKASRERLITANLRLVIAYSKRYANRGVSMDELVAEGNVGLIQAVDRFDPTMGCRFSTYAAFWIRQSIGQAFAVSLSSVTVRRRDSRCVSALDQAETSFMATHGHAPNGVEAGEVLGWTPEKVRTVQVLRQFRAKPANGTTSLSDLSIVDRGDAPPAALSVADAAANSITDVQRLLFSLSPIERKAVELRFGFDGGESRSARAVAAALDRPVRTTKAILRSALVKMSRLGYALGFADRDHDTLTFARPMRAVA